MQAGHSGSSRDVTFWLRVKNDPANAANFKTLASDIQKAQQGIDHAIGKSTAAMIAATQATIQKTVINIKQYATDVQKEMAKLEQQFQATTNRINSTATAGVNHIGFTGGASGGGRGGGGSYRGSTVPGIETMPAYRMTQGALEAGRGAALLGLMGEENERVLLQRLLMAQGGFDLGRGLLHMNQGFQQLNVNMGGATLGDPLRGTGIALREAGRLSTSGGQRMIGAMATTAGNGMLAAGAGGFGGVTIAAASIAALAAAIAAAFAGLSWSDYANGSKPGGFNDTIGQGFVGVGNQLKGIPGASFMARNFGGVAGAVLGNISTDDRGVNAAQAAKDAVARGEAVRMTHLQRAQDVATLRWGIQDIDRQVALQGREGATRGGQAMIFGRAHKELDSQIAAEQGRLAGLRGDIGTPDKLINTSEERITSLMEERVRLRREELNLAERTAEKEIQGAERVLKVLERQHEEKSTRLDRLKEGYESAALNFADFNPQERDLARRAKAKANAGEELSQAEQRILMQLGPEEMAQARASGIARANRLGFGNEFGKTDAATIANLEQQVKDISVKIEREQKIVLEQTLNAATIQRDLSAALTQSEQILSGFIRKVVLDELQKRSSAQGVFK